MRRSAIVFMFALFLVSCANPLGPEDPAVYFDGTDETAIGDHPFVAVVILEAYETGREKVTGQFSYSASAPREVEVTWQNPTYGKGFSPVTGEAAARVTQAAFIKTLIKGSTLVTFTYEGSHARKVVTVIGR